MKDNSAWGGKLGIRILEYQRSHSHFGAPCHDPRFAFGRSIQWLQSITFSGFAPSLPLW